VPLTSHSVEWEREFAGVFIVKIVYTLCICWWLLLLFEMQCLFKKCSKMGQGFNGPSVIEFSFCIQLYSWKLRTVNLCKSIKTLLCILYIYTITRNGRAIQLLGLIDNSQQCFPINWHFPQAHNQRRHHTLLSQPSRRAQNGGIPLPNTPDECAPLTGSRKQEE
jgi:hypothetical protein